MKLTCAYIAGCFAATLLLSACQSSNEHQQEASPAGDITTPNSDRLQATTDTTHFQPFISEFVPESSLLLEKLLEYPVQLQDADELLQKTSVPEAARLSRAAALACRLHFALAQQNKSQALVYQKALQSYTESMQLDFLRPIAGASMESIPIDSLLTLSRRALDQESAQRFLLNHYHSSYLAGRYVLSMWVEQLYLSCVIFEHQPKPSLKKLLAEQKIYLGNLMMYLSYYDRDPDMQKLNEQFERLMQRFEPITITYNYQRPTTEIKGNVLVVRQNDLMSFRIQDEDIIRIKDAVEKLRNYLLQQP